ncbi:unnamed protein product [Cladocopium goreaui]|uniref:Chorismate mutase n=1 Tax=Cladocopium goreaui TaxID=2562237 RepID=A0A9P1FP59_9DINO|nr:unnamed protein product [Cladocopium goreaui]
MDEPGPALRLLKRRLKQRICSSELRALPASPGRAEGPKIDWPGYPSASHVAAPKQGAGTLRPHPGSSQSLQLPSKDLEDSKAEDDSTKLERPAKEHQELGGEAALSFVLLPAAPALWKLEGKRVLLFRPGSTLEPRSYDLHGGAMEVSPTGGPFTVVDRLLPMMRHAVLQAQSLCIWLHGRRGSGKSRLMWGSLQDTRLEHPGVAQVLADGLFHTLKELELLPIREGDDKVLVTLQFLKFGVETELCGDCLVGPDFDPHLKPREALLGNGFFMDGAPEREVRQLSELQLALQRGVDRLRQVGTFQSGTCRKEDAMAHGLCTFRIRRRVGSEVHTSTIHLLDLVGAQMSADAKTKKRTSQEDRTLKAMLRVVDALAEDPEYKFRDGHTAPRHIPHRDSKVTRLLRPCLGGSGRSVLLSFAEGHDAILAELELATRHEGMTSDGVQSCIFDRESKMKEIEDEVAALCRKLGIVQPQDMQLTMDASNEEVRLAELLQLRRRVLNFEDWRQIRQGGLSFHKKRNEGDKQTAAGRKSEAS